MSLTLERLRSFSSFVLAIVVFFFENMTTFVSVPTGASWRLWEEVGTNQTASTPQCKQLCLQIAFKSLVILFTRFSLIIRLILMKD